MGWTQRACCPTYAGFARTRPCHRKAQPLSRCGAPVGPYIDAAPRLHSLPPDDRFPFRDSHSDSGDYQSDLRQYVPGGEKAVFRGTGGRVGGPAMAAKNRQCCAARSHSSSPYPIIGRKIGEKHRTHPRRWPPCCPAACGPIWRPIYWRRAGGPINRPMLPPTRRRTNLKGAFHVRRRFHSALKGRRILLVDDVLTTGATADAAARALLARRMLRSSRSPSSQGPWEKSRWRVGPSKRRQPINDCSTWIIRHKPTRLHPIRANRQRRPKRRRRPSPRKPRPRSSSSKGWRSFCRRS